MERHLKIVLMAFIGLVFPCLSFASPDFYYYNNFLTGQSPFSVPSSVDLEADGTWEVYNPVQDNIGVVTSFSKEFMQGAPIPSAVPAYNLDLYVGNSISVPAGQAVVVYSETSESTSGRFYLSKALPCMALGTTRATYQSSTALSFPTNVLYGSDYNAIPFPLQWTNANFPDTYYVGVTNFTQLIELDNSKSPYGYTTVYLILNYTDSSVNVKNAIGDFSNTVEVSGVPINDIDWIGFTSGTGSNVTDSNNNYMYLMPFIKGDLDIYTFTHSQGSSNSSMYYFLSNYSLKLNFDFSNMIKTSNWAKSYIPVTINNAFGINSASSQYGNYSLTSFPASNVLAPIFLHQLNATPYIYNKAIYVYDGYIDITNYEELVRLLKENGVGSSDLSRIERLLEEINSGGATGAEVKELIDVLENYHQQLVNNADFGSVTNVFESYKNLLDFSDDMHWLITANNALFGYFTGFILMCAMFLILSRIMR